MLESRPVHDYVVLQFADHTAHLPVDTAAAPCGCPETEYPASAFCAGVTGVQCHRWLKDLFLPVLPAGVCVRPTCGGQDNNPG